MDYSIILNIGLLIFSLMLLAVIMYLPVRILNFCIRGMVKATVKTTNSLSLTKH